MDMTWLSECCDAPVMGEVSAMGVGTAMFGRCSKCKECAEFYSPENENPNSPFSDPIEYHQSFA